MCNVNEEVSSNDSYLTITIKTGKDANLTYKIRLSEIIAYSKEISHTRIEQELECRNAKRNYNKILKELYLLTLKAYKNPSEQIKQLHDELNKL